MLYNKYAQGKIDANQFTAAVANLSGIQQKNKDKIDDLTTAHSTAKNAFEKTKDIQEKLKDAHDATSKAVEAVARQPEADGKITKLLIIGCALAEATAIYGFVIGLLAIILLK